MKNRGHVSGWNVMYKENFYMGLTFVEWEDINRYFFTIDNLVDDCSNIINTNENVNIVLVNKEDGSEIKYPYFNILYTPPDKVMIRDFRA